MTPSAETLLNLAWRQSWQVAVVALLVGAIALAVGRRRPHLAYLLWMLVLIKSLTPPIVSSPASPFHWIGSAPTESSISRPQSTQGDDMEAASAGAGPRPAEHGTIAHTATGIGPTRMIPTDGHAARTGAPSIALRLAAVWLAGAALLALAIAAGHLYLRFRLRRTARPIPAHVAARLRDLARTAGLTRTPTIVATTTRDGPAVYGVLRPRIVLPEDLIATASPEQLDAVLAHELIHIRRRDPLMAGVQTAALVLWWWHPLVWWASRAASRVREHCCDEELLAAGLARAEAYAQALIDVLRFRQIATSAVPLGLTALEVNRQRLENIMQPNRPRQPRCPRSCILAAVAASLIVLPGAPFIDRALTDDRLSSPPPSADVASEPHEVDERPPIQDTDRRKPELLYLTWQSGKDADNKPVPHVLWDRDGQLLSDEDAAQVLKRVGSFHVHWWRPEEELRPLVLVFQVDPGVERAPVIPTVLGLDDQRHVGGSARFRPTEGLNVSAASARKRDLAEWPQRVSLEIRYPVENVQTIRTVTEFSDAPIQVAEGVEWTLDRSRARTREAGRLVRAEGLAPVLRFERDRGDWELHSYSVRCYIRGQKAPLDEAYVTIVDGDRSGQYFIRVFETVASRDEIEKVEFTRQRYATDRIGPVPLRLDLLPDSE